MPPLGDPSISIIILLYSPAPSRIGPGPRGVPLPSTTGHNQTRSAGHSGSLYTSTTVPIILLLLLLPLLLLHLKQVRSAFLSIHRHRHPAHHGTPPHPRTRRFFAGSGWFLGSIESSEPQRGKRVECGFLCLERENLEFIIQPRGEGAEPWRTSICEWFGRWAGCVWRLVRGGSSK